MLGTSLHDEGRRCAVHLYLCFGVSVEILGSKSNLSRNSQHSVGRNEKFYWRRNVVRSFPFPVAAVLKRFQGVLHCLSQRHYGFVSEVFLGFLDSEVVVVAR